ncbi:MAG: carbohydrate ABC transporter permease [Candidatus Hydrogenedentes bacterium]|nr:carbohydrate ABC transporter permease [Candidatus Hydrogenedentota bacterium]
MVGTGRAAKAAAEAAVAAGALIVAAPVALLVVTAFKPDAEIIHFQTVLPQVWTLDNFREVLGNAEEIPMVRWFLNSVFISCAVTALILAVDSLAAYGLARLDLPGKRAVFALIVATLMVPGQLMLVPVYLILNALGWLDTPLALILPAGAGAFGVFLLRQFFLHIPRDLEDAAAIDGCSRLGIYARIILPLSKPALATLGIFTFMGAWNDFMGPLIFLDSVDKYTLPVGIALFQTSYSVEYGLTLAACLICTAPVLVVFALFQRHIVEGISLTGLKD